MVSAEGKAPTTRRPQHPSSRHSGSASPEVAPPASRVDWHVTKRIFDASQPVRPFAEFVTLTVDELLAFPVTAILGGFLFLVAPYVLAVGDPERQVLIEIAARQLLRMFGDFGAMCLLECALKFLFAMPRPPWMKRKEKPYYAMAGEWYCFPSGHSMRAAYVSVVLRNVSVSPLAALIAAMWDLETAAAVLGHPVVPFVFTAWALTGGWSRIALGKHFLGDVIVGLFLGFGIALSPYPVLLPGPPRLAMWCAFATQCLAIMSRAEWRALVRGWPCQLTIVVLSALTLPHTLAEREGFVPAG